MSDAIGNDLDREALGVADGFIPALAVTHYAGKLEGLRDPAPIFFPIQFDRQIHFFIIRPSEVTVVRKRRRRNGRGAKPRRLADR